MRPRSVEGGCAYPGRSPWSLIDGMEKSAEGIVGNQTGAKWNKAVLLVATPERVNLKA